MCHASRSISEPASIFLFGKKVFEECDYPVLSKGFQTATTSITVKQRQREYQDRRKGDDDVKMEAETETKGPQAEKVSSLRKLAVRNRFFSTASRGSVGCTHLGFELLVSKAVRK